MDEIHFTQQIQSETEEDGVKITAAETKADTLKPDMVLFTSWLLVSCEISSATVGKYTDILKSLDQKTWEKLGTSIFELRTLKLLHNIFMGYDSGIRLNKDEKKALVYYVTFLLCEYVSFWRQGQWLNSNISPVSDEFEDWLFKHMKFSYYIVKEYMSSLNAINAAMENKNLSLFKIKNIKDIIEQKEYFLHSCDKKGRRILNYYLFYLLDLALYSEERQEEGKVGLGKSHARDFEAWCLKENFSLQVKVLTKEFADRLSQYCVEHRFSPSFDKISLEEQFKAVIDVYTSSEAYDTLLTKDRYRNCIERYGSYLMDRCDAERLMDILDVGRNDAHLPLLVSGDMKTMADGYSKWLKSNNICAVHSSRTYISSLYACDKIAREQFSASFFENKNKREVAYLRFKVARHPKYNSRHLGALRMYVQYLSSYRLISKDEHRKNTQNLLGLVNRRLGGEISLETDADYDKLYSVWQKEYGTGLLYSREDIRTMISRNTMFDSERHVYITKEMFLPEATQCKIFHYIRNYFEAGARLVDYAQIVELIREDGLNIQVKQLQEFLKKFNDGSYVCENKYIQANDSSLQGGDLASEICNKVREQTAPISKDALKALLPSISKDRFNKILTRNNFSALYGVIIPKQGEIFHADLICFTESELFKIKNLMVEELRSKSYVTSLQLFDIVRNVRPNILEEYPFLSPSSSYAVLRHKLGRDFKFNISCVTSEKAMEITDIFMNFCKQHDEFSLSDLLQLAKQLGADSIPFTYIYEISARVSYDLFVNRENLQFETAYIDHLLDAFCPREFTIIGQFSHLDMLPPMNGHPWSIYLLEHYLSFYSCKFSLFSRNYTRRGCYGLIARKATGIQDFNEAVAQYLVNAPVELEFQAVIQHLCHVGILGARRYVGIDTILNKVRELRNIVHTNVRGEPA